MALPAEFLDKLRELTPLAELIGGRVKLIQSGRQAKGVCPFHEDKTLAFYVYSEHFHCFGCGAHGDAITFLMLADSLTFHEAVKLLAGDAKIAVPAWESDARLIAPVPKERPTITNKSAFSDAQLESILGTAARLLVRQKHVTAASILANAGGHMAHWQHDNWDGGQDIWRLSLAIPAEVYFDLEGKEDLETQINASLNTAIEVLQGSNFIVVKIVTSLDEDPDWRHKVNQHISGEGITNQGRVRSDNIATRQHDGLLFRSMPEIHFYDALKRSGVPFAPLSVVLHGGMNYRRVEPDFMIYKHGLTMLVEIDGDLFHPETPAAAHARLKFITDEGATLDRITASECNTPQKAQEAVERVLATIDKIRRGR